MANGWSPKNKVLEGGITVGASLSDSPITEQFPITAGGSRYMVVVVIASGVSGTVTAKLQSGVDASYWETARTAALSNGANIIRLNNDASTAQIPLLAAGRIVVDTAAASGATIEKVYILQEL